MAEKSTSTTSPFAKFWNLSTGERNKITKTHLHTVKNPITKDEESDVRAIEIDGKRIDAPIIRSSWNLVGFIMLYSSLTKNDKLVAAQIASHYNRDSGECYPSYSSLMKTTGLSRKAVGSAIAAIKYSGEWHVVPGKKGTNSKYYPLLPFMPQENSHG